MQQLTTYVKRLRKLAEAKQKSGPQVEEIGKDQPQIAADNLSPILGIF